MTLSRSLRSDNVRRRSARRLGIALIVIVIAIVVIIGGVGSYFIFVYRAPAPGAPRASTTTTTTSTVGRTTTTSNAFSYYSGTFTYSNPIGPTGDEMLPNGTVAQYGTVTAASGSFTFFVNPANYSGSGSGQGMITATTTGYCTGQTSFPYTFVVEDPNTILGGNLTVGFGTPKPLNITYQLTCTAINGTQYTTGASYEFLSVYPNLISAGTLPVTLTMNESGIYYLITLKHSP